MFSTIVALMALAPSVHLHVDGEGYLRFVREGRTVYAKEAMLTVTDGKLASVDGRCDQRKRECKHHSITS